MRITITMERAGYGDVQAAMQQIADWGFVRETSNGGAVRNLTAGEALAHFASDAGDDVRLFNDEVEVRNSGLVLSYTKLVTQ